MWPFAKKKPAPAPSGAAHSSMVGHEVVAVNTPPGSLVGVGANRINARLARIEQGLIDAEARRVDRGDAGMEQKIEQLEAERTMLRAQKVLRGV